MSETIVTSPYEPPAHIARARERFEAKLRTNSVSGCRIYEGRNLRRFTFDGFCTSPHRFAWRLWRGPLESGPRYKTGASPEQVWPCPIDKRCVEPSHLALENQLRYTAEQKAQMALNHQRWQEHYAAEARRLQREFEERRANGELLA